MVDQTIRTYRDLDAWRVAMDLTDAVYEVAGRLPDTERYGMRTQMQRAAVSVPSNVAEGQSYGPGRRYAHHLRISLGSIGELGTLLEIAVRRRYVNERVAAALEEQLVRTRQLVHGLLRSVQRQRVKSAMVWLTFLFPPAGLLFTILR